MDQWDLQTLKLPLKFTWKISRGESSEKLIYFLRMQTEGLSSVGEMAGITADPQKADALIELFHELKDQKFNSWEDLQNLNIPSHLKFGMSSAWTHFQAMANGQSLHQHLELQDTTPIETSFSLPILPLDEIAPFYEKFELSRFSILKLKVSNDKAIEACQELARIYKGPLRIDANEAFASAQEVMGFLSEVKNLPIQFIEEPMRRGSVEEYKKLKGQSPFPIFADESVQDAPLAESLREQFHGINVKLMKAGSYQRARQQIEQATDWNMQTMLGCMVETSLGIAGAMTIAQDVTYFDLDGFLYFENEPYKLVTENQGKLTYRQNPSFHFKF